MNIRNAQNSWMAGKRQWEQFIADFEMKWNAPAMLESMLMTMAQIPPEIMDNLPVDTQERIKKMIGGNGNAR